MGAGWFDAMGAGWFDAMGAGWTDSGGGGGASNLFFMRVDRPLAEEPVTSNFGAKFRDSEWDSDLLALSYLPSFLAHRRGGQDWEAYLALPGPAPVTQAVIDDLLMLAVTERPEALGDIVQQHQNFQLCFLHLLNMSRNSHPRTFRLMKIAARIGELAMITLKRRHPAKARPSQICPTLYPPVTVPGHASYPAGHALIAWLTAKCLADVAPAFADSLEKLADRVGFNRVIAGLHFRNDVDVGAAMGRKLHDFIADWPPYQNLTDPASATSAAHEWQ